MSNTWAEIQSWAKHEIEKARSGLERVTDATDMIRLQTRIAVMRELHDLRNTPAKPEIPAPVGY